MDNKSLSKYSQADITRIPIGKINKKISLMRIQKNVLYALMLHDIKARFFGSGLGYLVTIIWPYAHILVLVLPFVLGGRLAPYGNSPSLYVATGVMPFVAFNYICRPMIMGGITNKSFLQYPIIKVNDVIIARALLETLNVFLTTLLVMVTFSIAGVDVWPRDTLVAGEALIASVFLGFGVGYLNAVVALAYPIWATVSILVTILIYISCGIVINPVGLPSEVVYYLSFNPVMHGVLWMRGAYFPGYGDLIIDKQYMIGFAGTSLASGLIFERLGRRIVLGG